MEFRIRQNRIGFYIDLCTDNGLIVIEGANKFHFREDAEAAINSIKEPIVYIANPQVTEASSSSDWDSGLSMGGIKEDSYDDDDWDSTFKFSETNGTKNKDSVNVTGRGLVFIVDLQENGYENAKEALPFLKPDTVIVVNDKSYIIRGVEARTAMNGIYHKVGIVVRERTMTYEEKCEQFRETKPDSKTLYDELPIKFGLSSSSRHPEDHRAGIVTCDLVLWMKFLEHWFQPNPSFSQNQIEQMIAMCKNDDQLIALIEMLGK